MAFQDPVVGERFCKPCYLHMGQWAGVWWTSIGSNIVDDYGDQLLKLYCDVDQHYHIHGPDDNIIATICRKITSRRQNGWTMYRGRSNKKRDTICETESMEKSCITNIYLGSSYKGKDRSKNVDEDYRIEGRSANFFKTNHENLIAYQVHNVCVSSTNSGPKIRVYPGADYIFIYAMIFVHKSYYENMNYRPSLSSADLYLTKSLCSCCNCTNANLKIHKSRYQSVAPLVVSNRDTNDKIVEHDFPNEEKKI